MLIQAIIVYLWRKRCTELLAHFEDDMNILMFLMNNIMKTTM